MGDVVKRMTPNNTLKNRNLCNKTLKNNLSLKEGSCYKKRMRAEHAQIAELVSTAVAHSLRVPPKDLFSHSRCQAQTALARQMAIYLLHTGIGLSLNQVAPLFKRDRTTVAHACRKIEEMRDNRDIDTLLGHLERGLEAWQHAFQFVEMRP